MLSQRFTMAMVIQKVSNGRGGWVCTFFLWQTVTEILLIVLISDLVCLSMSCGRICDNAKKFLAGT